MSSPSSIYVAIRVRPFNPREKKQKDKNCIEVSPDLREIRLCNFSTGVVQAYTLDEIMDSSCDPNDSYVWNKDSLKNSSSTEQRLALQSAKDRYYNQERVYSTIGRKFFDEICQGFNASIFAYGQTGSGKTTSVVGDFGFVTSNQQGSGGGGPGGGGSGGGGGGIKTAQIQELGEQAGILPRLLNDLFNMWNGKKANGWIVDVRVRMLEVYNERLQDLLSPKQDTANKKKLEVRLHPKLGVYIPDLTINAVETTGDCLSLLEYGHSMQTVASTAMNARSSRAHTIFGIRVECSKESEYTNVSENQEIFIVDLAGRENERTTLVTGERLVELSFINKSLFHLANCIHALGSSESKAAGGAKYADSNANKASSDAKDQTNKATGLTQGKRDIQVANFRNSKLTLLLSEALSGNSKTFMIGTLTPAFSSHDENQVTLRFAATVKNIKLKASKLAESKTDRVKALGDEVARLKAELASAQSGKGTGPSTKTLIQDDEAIKELQEQLQAAQAATEESKRTWQEAKSQANKFSSERQEMIKKQEAQRLQYQSAIDAMKKQFEVPLPYITNVTTSEGDSLGMASMTGKLQYSFSRGGSFFFGNDITCLIKYCNETVNNISSVNSDHLTSKPENDAATRCIMVAGLGISAKLCKFVSKVAFRRDDGTVATKEELESEVLNNNGKVKRLTQGNSTGSGSGDVIQDEISKRVITLQITRITSEGVVSVNNDNIDTGKSINLQQGDTVILGRSHLFRCYIDKSESEMTESERAKWQAQANNQDTFRTPEALEKCIRDLLRLDGSRGITDGNSASDIADANQIYLAKCYINALKSISVDQEAKVFRFLYEARKLASLVQEANEITQCVRPQDQLRFELNTMSPSLFMGYPGGGFVPQSLIRVIRILSPAQRRWKLVRDRVQMSGAAAIGENGNKSLLHVLTDTGLPMPQHQSITAKAQQQGTTSADDGSSNNTRSSDVTVNATSGYGESDVELLFIWSVTKFVGRLDMMRDIYHSWMLGTCFTVDLREDPWVEAGPVEMEFWIREKEEEKNKEIMGIQEDMVRLQEDLSFVHRSKDDYKQRLIQSQKETALVKKELEEIQKVQISAGASMSSSGGGGGASGSGGGANTGQSIVELRQQQAKSKAQLDALNTDLDQLKKENEKLKKKAEAGEIAAESEKKSTKKLKEMKDLFRLEKSKMMDRFVSEKESLREELDRRIGEFRRKLDTEKKNILSEQESEKDEMRNRFEKEKEELKAEMEAMRLQYKQDLAMIRNLEAGHLGYEDNSSTNNFQNNNNNNSFGLRDVTDTNVSSATGNYSNSNTVTGNTNTTTNFTPSSRTAAATTTTNVNKSTLKSTTTNTTTTTSIASAKKTAMSTSSSTNSTVKASAKSTATSARTPISGVRR